MRLRKSVLRECARLALEQRGFRLEAVLGPGVVPGSRLRASTQSGPREIAVRSSTDREIGLVRRPDGRWATIPRMDEVIVVAPAAENPNVAEVLSFAPEIIVRTFDRALAVRQTEKPDLSLKAPIFVALDAPIRGLDQEMFPALKAQAQWQMMIPLAAVPPHRRSPRATAAGLLERFKQELADLHGVDVSKVTVEIHITS
jgi:hypothetical protein